MTNPNPERADLPRLLASSVEGLGNMEADFMVLFKESSLRSDIGNNWQSVIDMITTRYFNRL
jgi:hypothetical protein